jgi:protein-tyrosine phosphatase
MQVMAVCTGNICRSVMAETVLRQRLADAGLGDQVTVVSRGVSSEEAGNPIDRRARAALLARGYPGGDGHTARQITPRELASSDLVLAMTSGHARTLRRLAPPDAPTIVMYRAFDPTAPIVTTHDEHRLDIDDPWYGGPQDFETSLDQIENAADGIITHLRHLLA